FFACPATDLKSAVTTVVEYHFGVATNIRDWWVPLHRRPDWDIARVSDLIAKATFITYADWKTLPHWRVPRTRRWAPLPPHARYDCPQPWSWHVSHLLVGNSDPENGVLCLAENIQHAYIVRPEIEELRESLQKTDSDLREEAIGFLRLSGRRALGLLEETRTA